MQTFHANGKLLLSGEYFILDGAKGLALPTKMGQNLTISETTLESGIQWTALDHEGQVWFRTNLSGKLDVVETTAPELAETLKKVLEAVVKLKGEHLSGFSAITRLQFPMNWGLGSSSTLISLISQWVKCDPYELLKLTFGGSGYDVACATANQPITYKLNKDERIVERVNFNPAFADSLYFLHLGKKQDSRSGIQHYKSLLIDKTEMAEQITDITNKLLQAAELDEFCYYLDLHEALISNALQLQKVKDKYFSGFPGSIKSLGAWGGDFVCVASDEDEAMIRSWFIDKGFPTLLKYSDVILL